MAVEPLVVAPGCQFYSDNAAGICPEAWESMAEANVGHAPPYGADEWTTRVQDKFREIFEKDCAVFFFTTGTAANATVMAHLCRPYQSIICSRTAHIDIGECGASGYFAGGAKLLPVDGPDGKVDPAEARRVATAREDIEFTPCRVLSVTQPTEYGTVYTPGEIAALAKVARECGLRLHVDGARFANAVAALELAPKAMSWELGVDVLSLGGTKNGLAAGEAVVFFDRQLADEFEYRQKQTGQLWSKSRFLSAAWLGVLETGAWLEHAQHANRSATRLRDKLCEVPGVRGVFPVQANAVYVQMPSSQIAALVELGWELVTHLRSDAIRLMCSWSTTDRDIDAFVADVRETVSE